MKYNGICMYELLGIFCLFGVMKCVQSLQYLSNVFPLVSLDYSVYIHTTQAKGLATMMPMNAVAVAAGNIHSLEQVAELGYYGYDSVVLGRHIADVRDCI